VGALYDMIQPFKKHGINLSNIVSRPTKQEAWQYMFFLECEGHYQDPFMKNAIADIEKHSLYVRVLGSYPRAQDNSKFSPKE
jgi:chorismate mutase/prephenate dehydratase